MLVILNAMRQSILPNSAIASARRPVQRTAHAARKRPWRTHTGRYDGRSYPPSALTGSTHGPL